MARALDGAGAGGSAEAPILGLELNLSCPNVAEGGANFATDPQAVRRITRQVRDVYGSAALWVKLSPNVTDIAAIAEAAQVGGADAICAINTLLAMDIDLETGKSPFARTFAGLSGPAIFPVALADVHRIAKRVSIPIVAIGGAASSGDVLKFLAAGASAVQLGTALFSNPGLPARILSELEAFLMKHDCRSFDDLRALWAKKAVTA